jgi:hypothetical protein
MPLVARSCIIPDQCDKRYSAAISLVFITLLLSYSTLIYTGAFSSRVGVIILLILFLFSTPFYFPLTITAAVNIRNF